MISGAIATTHNKLDYDVLTTAVSRLNPIGERELDLRGYKFQRIENLSLTKDQNDALDLTDNDIKKVENIPKLPRLKTLLLANNRIVKLDKDLAKYVPNLKTLILSNNQISELGDLDPLLGLTHLHTLSLIDNPVSLRKYFRLYVIHKCPSIRILDFRRIRQKERIEAIKLFSGEKGTALLASLLASSKVAPSVDNLKDRNTNEEPKKAPARYQGPSPEEAARIAKAISESTSLEEITRLERMLEGGIVPDAKK